MTARRCALLALSAALALPAAVQAQPETAAMLLAQGLKLRAMRAEEMVSFGRTEITKWAELVKRSGAQVD